MYVFLEYDEEECKPRVIETEIEYEGVIGGLTEYSTNSVYNCQNCDNKECEHYKNYN